MASVLTIHLPEQYYPNLMRNKYINPVGKKTSLLWDSMSTATSSLVESCWGTIKTQSCFLNCDFKNVLYLSKNKDNAEKNKFRY